MPLKVNVGLTRKVGESNYGSRGASVNLDLELDGSLVNEPAKLKEKIAQAFSLVRTSLDAELNGHANGNGNGHAPTNGKANGTSSPPAKAAPKPRPATQSQIKAIYRIAEQRGHDLGHILHDQFQASKPEELTIAQASAVIDHLKSLSE
jgi:hypothetical protein